MPRPTSGDQPRFTPSDESPASDGPDGSTSADPLAGIVDPDIDEPGGTPAAGSQVGPVIATAVGGVIGAEARYGIGLALPHAGSAFPWSTVLINASGCFALGALMVVLLELTRPHRLARPLLGVGVLGGYTTYSTFAVDVQRLLVDHRPATALGYVVVTVAACALAVWIATVLALAIGRRVISNGPSATGTSTGPGSR